MVQVVNDINKNLPEVLDSLHYSQIVVIADENTGALCYPVVTSMPDRSAILIVNSGEQHKTIDWCRYLWAQLLNVQADRNALIINLGGGMITDIGGFVAGTYKRGIRYINIPTSLLGMVDASVGGKTGINYEGVKNSIGLFNDAEATLIDPVFLKTLPQRHVKNGLAEMLKHGLIADADHWKEFVHFELNEEPLWTDWIKSSVRIKEDIVNKDPKENGLRKNLNFGHTIGHAIESWALEKNMDVLHGEAIAAGMYCETYLSKNRLGLSDESTHEIYQTLDKLFAKIKIPESAFYRILEITQNDKKNEFGDVLFSLIPKIGSCRHNIEVDERLIIDSLNFYNEV